MLDHARTASDRPCEGGLSVSVMRSEESCVKPGVAALGGLMRRTTAREAEPVLGLGEEAGGSEADESHSGR